VKLVRDGKQIPLRRLAESATRIACLVIAMLALPKRSLTTLAGTPAATKAKVSKWTVQAVM
jgi:hypothetical protein